MLGDFIINTSTKSNSFILTSDIFKMTKNSEQTLLEKIHLKIITKQNLLYNKNKH